MTGHQVAELLSTLNETQVNSLKTIHLGGNNEVTKETVNALK